MYEYPLNTIHANTITDRMNTYGIPTEKYAMNPSTAVAKSINKELSPTVNRNISTSISQIVAAK